jgi:hypothetical protein
VYSAAVSGLICGSATRPIQHIIEYTGAEAAGEERMGVENAGSVALMRLDKLVSWLYTCRF